MTTDNQNGAGPDGTLSEISSVLGVSDWREVVEPDEAVWLTIDGVPFDAKPNESQVRAITSRMKDPASAMELSFARFCKALRLGVTWCGGVFEGGWGRTYFKSQRLFAVDIDNKTDVLDDYGEPVKNADGSIVQRPLEECESLFLSPVHALQRAYLYDLEPVCLYFSKSSTPEHPRFRVVFDAGEAATTVEEADAIIANLMSLYPECDPACKNLNRLWFGSNGEVWEAWRVRTVSHVEE